MSLGDHVTAEALRKHLADRFARTCALMVEMYNKDEHCSYVRPTEAVLVCECWRVCLSTKDEYSHTTEFIFYECPESVSKKDRATAA